MQKSGNDLQTERRILIVLFCVVGAVMFYGANWALLQALSWWAGVPLLALLGICGAVFLGLGGLLCMWIALGLALEALSGR